MQHFGVCCSVQEHISDVLYHLYLIGKLSANDLALAIPNSAVTIRPVARRQPPPNPRRHPASVASHPPLLIILGAGGGGFLLLYAPAERHEEICGALPELRPIAFQFEPQGSKLIFIEENGYAP